MAQMYGISLSEARVEVERHGWAVFNDIAFLRRVAQARDVVERTKDEEQLPTDPLTQLVADVIGEQLLEQLHERERKAGLRE